MHFGYSDNLSLSNFKLPQKFTAKPDDSNCHGTQEGSGMGFGGRFQINANVVYQARSCESMIGSTQLDFIRIAERPWGRHGKPDEREAGTLADRR
jgi:hypothetical protein